MRDSSVEIADVEPEPGPVGHGQAGIAALVVVEAPTMVGWTGLEMTAMAAVVVVAAALAGWWSWRFLDGESDDAVPPELPAPATAGSSGERRADRSATQTPDSGRHRAVSARSESEIEEVFLGSDDEMPARQCPECDRKFPGVFDVCPFDSSSLRRPGGGESGDRLPRQFCPDCGRRYELGTEHCYHDGRQLRRDTAEASRQAATMWVCRDCGFETKDGDLEACPEDGQLLTRLDPTRRRRVKPAFPYNRCRQCGHIGAPDQTRCPDDGSLMLPELDAPLTALPPTGHGSRRCVCPECGLGFGGHCNFCSRDGTELVVLN